MSTYDKHHKILLITGNLNDFIANKKKRRCNVNKKMIVNSIAAVKFNYDIDIIWIDDEKAALDFLFELMRKYDAGHTPRPVKVPSNVLLSLLLNLSLLQYKELLQNKGSISNILTTTTQSDLKKLSGIGDVKSKQIKEIIDNL